jgi:DNA-binding CsgD family transcriptional regulator
LAEALPLWRAADAKSGIAWALFLQAWAARRRGEPARAAALYHECLVLYDRAGVRVGVADALGALADIAVLQGRPELAARLLGAAETEYARIGGVATLDVRVVHEAAEAGIRAALDEETFALAKAAGQQLSLSEAIAETGAFAREPATRTTAATRVDPPRRGSDPGFSLTPRESEVLALLVRRYTDPEIAEALFISPHTASTHVKRVLGKLGAANRRAAAAIAARHGLV